SSTDFTDLLTIPTRRSSDLSLVLSGLNELEVANFTHHPKALIVATRSLIMAGNLELAESYLSALPDQQQWLGSKLAIQAELALQDRKSTRLNSSHVKNSYAV